MTDLEITNLCAEAMGYEFITSRNKNIKMDLEAAVVVGGLPTIYQPLRDDAQAMALVKRFKLELYWVGSENYGDEFDTDDWMVAQSTVKLSNCGNDVRNADLNRAICECVANMQKGK